MSKSVLIIDTPENCDKCRFHYNTYDENDCYVDKCELLNMTIDGYTEKYDNCPLKELPERKDGFGTDTLYIKGKIDGWNYCLAEILGE